MPSMVVEAVSARVVVFHSCERGEEGISAGFPRDNFRGRTDPWSVGVGSLSPLGPKRPRDVFVAIAGGGHVDSSSAYSNDDRMMCLMVVVVVVVFDVRGVHGWNWTSSSPGGSRRVGGGSRRSASSGCSVLGARASRVRVGGVGWAEGGGVVCAECRVPRNTSCDEKRVRTGSLPSGSTVYPTTVYQTARVLLLLGGSPIELDGRMRAPTSDRADTI